MFWDFPKLLPFQRSIFGGLDFIFSQKFWVSCKVNKQITRCGDPVKDCGENCCAWRWFRTFLFMIFQIFFTKNVKAVFIFPENVEEHVPRLCPWVPEITSDKKVHRSSKNSWLLMRLFRSFQEYLQSCSMENQYKSLKVDYIYRSIQEDVPSSLHWFLLVHPSSERVKQNEQLQNLFFINTACLSWFLFVSHNISDFVLESTLIPKQTVLLHVATSVVIIMYSEYLHSKHSSVYCDCTTLLSHIFITLLKA